MGYWTTWRKAFSGYLRLGGLGLFIALFVGLGLRQGYVNWQKTLGPSAEERWAATVVRVACAQKLETSPHCGALVKGSTNPDFAGYCDRHGQVWFWPSLLVTGVSDTVVTHELYPEFHCEQTGAPCKSREVRYQQVTLQYKAHVSDPAPLLTQVFTDQEAVCLQHVWQFTVRKELPPLECCA